MANQFKIKDGLYVSGSARIDSNTSITGSLNVVGGITGSLFGTSSQSVSSSYALTASYSANVPLTSSYALEALTASYAVTASYSANVPVTSSYALQALSASYSLTASQAVSSSTSLTASYVQNAQSASYVLNAVSASYAQTSSYSLSGTGFPFSGSAVITGSLLITNLSGSGVRYVVTDQNGLMTAQTASTVIKTTQTYTASAGQTTFSVTNGYSTGYVDVFINGSKLNNTEFTDTSGTNVVLATGSFSNDIVEVVKYLPAQGVSNNVLRTLTTFTAAASQSTYTVDYTPGLIDIFYNGARLSPVEYTANNGTSFTLATASFAGDLIDVLVYSYQVGAYAGIGGSGQLNQVSYYTTTSSISGSNNFTFDGSTLRVTGSIITSGSSTFTNIGPTILSGSLTVSGSITAVGGITISGSIDSASYASNAEKLDNFDSTAFVFTSSYNTDSGSFSTRVTTLEAASASLNTASGSFSTRVTKIEGNYATTGSNIFTGAQTVCANITSTGTIIAQTLNVQQVTSSIVYSSGSNTFGCDLTNIQQFTGSVRVTGSLIVNNGSFIGNCFAGSSIVGGAFGTTTLSNTQTTNGVVAGVYANQWGFIDMSSQNACGPWIDFSSGSGDDYQGRIRYNHANHRMDFYVCGAALPLVSFSNTSACFACDLTAKTLGTNDLILNNLNYECANYVDGTRGSWLIQEGACDLFIINQVSGKKYKFNLIEIK